MAGSPENARGEQGKFKPGKSGNPAGKPPGTRHKTTLAVEALLDGEAEALTRKAVEMALAGDSTALRLCLERIAPVRKGRTVQFALPPVETASDIAASLQALLDAIAGGEVTPDEAVTVASVLEIKRKAMETVDFEARLARLEETAK